MKQSVGVSCGAGKSRHAQAVTAQSCKALAQGVQFIQRRAGAGHLGLILPRGATKVVGGLGRSEVEVLGGDVSFLGFFVILLLRCSPLAIHHLSWASRGEMAHVK